MRLTFVKGSGKYDHLEIDRSGLPVEVIQCPKQGIIPHDMIHYAVESTVPHRGFLTLLSEGKPASFSTQGGDAAEAVERRVETLQAELWSGRIPVADAIEMYEHGCRASGHAVAPVSGESIEIIRLKMDELTAAWTEVPTKGRLNLVFEGADPHAK